MRWGFGAFRNSVYKAHAQAFPSFFSFFSFFVLFSFFFLFLLGFVCWALLSVYTGHIFQGRTLFFVCGAHRLFPTQSPPSSRGGNASTSPPTPTPLSLPFGSFRLSVIYKKKNNKNM